VLQSPALATTRTRFSSPVQPKAHANEHTETLQVLLPLLQLQAISFASRKKESTTEGEEEEKRNTKHTRIHPARGVNFSPQVR
jgi:hypothetical protein